MFYLFVSLATVVPVLALLAVWAGSDPWLAGDIAGVCIFVGAVGLLATARDKLIERWCWISTAAHLGWELPFVLLSRRLVGVTEHDTWAFLFWTYGTADRRYISADVGIVAIEAVTSFLVAPLVVYVLVLLRRKQTHQAHVWLVLASACQLYGLTLYVLEEGLRGFASLGKEPIGLWIKVIGLNSLWFLMPAYLLYRLVPQLLRAPRADAETSTAA